jgi:hypothetical protein
LLILKQIHLNGFDFVTCCFKIFIWIKTSVLPPNPYTNSWRKAFAWNIESHCNIWIASRTFATYVCMYDYYYKIYYKEWKPKKSIKRPM